MCRLSSHQIYICRKVSQFIGLPVKSAQTSPEAEELGFGRKLDEFTIANGKPWPCRGRCRLFSFIDTLLGSEIENDLSLLLPNNRAILQSFFST